MYRIKFINNDGNGYAQDIDVRAGTTITQFVAEKFPNKSSADLTIRVNRDVTVPEYVLQSGDRVSVTPNKVAGACR